jgi:enoyl-[acyl-carrier protein] reductase I
MSSVESKASPLSAFLAHDAAKLMTGDTVYIDGGYHIID